MHEPDPLLGLPPFDVSFFEEVPSSPSVEGDGRARQRLPISTGTGDNHSFGDYLDPQRTSGDTRPLNPVVWAGVTTTVRPPGAGGGDADGAVDAADDGRRVRRSRGGRPHHDRRHAWTLTGSALLLVGLALAMVVSATPGGTGRRAAPSTEAVTGRASSGRGGRALSTGPSAGAGTPTAEGGAAVAPAGGGAGAQAPGPLVTVQAAEVPIVESIAPLPLLPGPPRSAAPVPAAAPATPVRPPTPTTTPPTPPTTRPAPPPTTAAPPPPPPTTPPTTEAPATTSPATDCPLWTSQCHR